MKARLDQALVERGLVTTRARARDLILRGQVSVGGEIASKPAQTVSRTCKIALMSEDAHYVSRGALKLIAALDAFDFDCNGVSALDVGASTGGFTQVLLERGAAEVVAVDVGRGQLHPTIAADPRVRSYEKTDARNLAAIGLAADRTAIVCDVSFISLTKVLPAILPFAAPGAWLSLLVKPQFEVGRDRIGKGGIVRDETARRDAIDSVAECIARTPGWTVEGIIDSPVPGGDGNREALIGARHG